MNTTSIHKMALLNRSKINHVGHFTFSVNRHVLFLISSKKRFSLDLCDYYKNTSHSHRTYACFFLLSLNLVECRSMFLLCIVSFSVLFGSSDQTNDWNVNIHTENICSEHLFVSSDAVQSSASTCVCELWKCKCLQSKPWSS